MRRFFTARRKLLCVITMTPPKITYESGKEFSKDIARLQKKFSTLPEDLEIAKKAAIQTYHVHRRDSGGIFRITYFPSEEVEIYKLKKFACRELKGRGVRSGIRVIYAFFPDTRKVVFIEMYFKGDKESEDRRRIQRFLKKDKA